jgi:hypothetical protein
MLLELNYTGYLYIAINLNVYEFCNLYFSGVSRKYRHTSTNINNLHCISLGIFNLRCRLE